MPFVHLGLGTNLGDKEANLNAAIAKLSKLGAVIKQSSFHNSIPWGFESGNHFLNAVVLIESTLSPLDLLAQTQQIESELGRTSKSINGYSDRIIDIDILLYDDQIINAPELKIPHPLITERDFVLIPLLEISPDVINPITGETYKNFR
jgi:2-amino-4-hydroxy-6-hydroxymethyldihydropteridine diphosphokinase